MQDEGVRAQKKLASVEDYRDNDWRVAGGNVMCGSDEKVNSVGSKDGVGSTNSGILPETAILSGFAIDAFLERFCPKCSVNS